MSEVQLNRTNGNEWACENSYGSGETKETISLAVLESPGISGIWASCLLRRTKHATNSAFELIFTNIAQTRPLRLSGELARSLIHLCDHNRFGLFHGFFESHIG